MLDRANLEQVILSEPLLLANVDRIMKQSQLGWAFKPGTPSMAVGPTRPGGLPDLRDEEAWPDGLCFVGQINLAQLPARDGWAPAEPWPEVLVRVSCAARVEWAQGVVGLHLWCSFDGC